MPNGPHSFSGSIGSIACCLAFSAVAASAHAQTAPSTKAPAAPKRGPGDPLPPMDLTWERLGSETGADGVMRYVATGSVTLTYGDLQIKADKITYTPDGLFIEATGHVSVVRGDESLRGERFTFLGSEGTADTERTVIISPPFYVSADRFTQGNDGGLLRNARITPSPDGKGELSLSAREIQLTADGRRAILRDMTIRLFGTRLLTVRHARIPLGAREREGERDKNGFSIPATLRVSGISGITIGARIPITLDAKTSGEYGIEFPQRNSTQYFARVRRDLIPNVSVGRERSGSAIFALPGGMGDPATAGLSPLRRIAIARPLPPAPDPILDYDSILVSPDPVERPLRGISRNLFAEVNISGNRDVSNKRQGPLLLSRTPEVQISGSLPLIGMVPQETDNDTLRRFLRRPHLQVTGNVIAGQYRERRLRNDRETIDSGRTGASLGVGMLPLLIGEHILLRPQVTANYFHYSSDGSPAYRYLESRVTLDYVFFGRTMIGGSYIRRDQSGSTPFTFDEIDTQDEGQLRAQVGLPGSKFTVASQIRYDLRQSHIFDTEIAIAWRGKSIEPRFSYRTQNSQFGFGVTLPGFLP